MSNSNLHPLLDSLSERYNRQIYSKVGVSSRTQATTQAKTFGLLGEGISVSPSLPQPLLKSARISPASSTQTKPTVELTAKFVIQAMIDALRGKNQLT